MKKIIVFLTALITIGTPVANDYETALNEELKAEFIPVIMPHFNPEFIPVQIPESEIIYIKPQH